MSATHDGIEKVNKELAEKIKENIKLEEEKKELEIRLNDKLKEAKEAEEKQRD